MCAALLDPDERQRELGSLDRGHEVERAGVVVHACGA
jgi:hypothetical protein